MIKVNSLLQKYSKNSLFPVHVIDIVENVDNLLLLRKNAIYCYKNAIYCYKNAIYCHKRNGQIQLNQSFAI